MKQHNVLQGSPEWLALRANYFTASEAPAMMGCSPYMTRTELLNQKHTGLVPAVDIGTQKRYDNGHAVESAFRPIAEEIIGDDLYPVTGSVQIDGLNLLASFDGLTMDEAILFEHKAFNQAAAGHIDLYGEPPQHHVWQLEQQLLVSGAKHALFVTSDGTLAGATYCQYESKPDRRSALIAGWKQFAADLAAWVPPEAKPAPVVGKTPDNLPALLIQVTGAVTASNLPEFKAHALEVFRGINRTLTTDQDFATAESTVKWCADVESRLAAAKEHALSQTATIDELFRTIDDISAEARRTRLELDKLVKARKEEIRGEIVAGGITVLREHIAQLNAAMPADYMPQVPADFAGVIKGKRTVDSLRSAVNDELARAKIEASNIATRIHANVKTLKASGLVVTDAAVLVLKAPDDLAAIIENRVAKFKADEAAREAAQAAIAAAQAPAVQQVMADAVTTGTGISSCAVTVNGLSLTRIEPSSVHKESDVLIKLGDINTRLAPVSISADGLAELGFVHVRQDKAAKLYRDADYPAIVHAIVTHLSNSLQVQPA